MQEADEDLIPEWRRAPGERNGIPLQYACLENPMDRGAWWATVHSVGKSWTQLSEVSPCTVRITPSLMRGPVIRPQSLESTVAARRDVGFILQAYHWAAPMCQDAQGNCLQSRRGGDINKRLMYRLHGARSKQGVWGPGHPP